MLRAAIVDFVIITGVFLLAGTVKGCVGLGLPPIAMGLLVTVMTPVEAAALLVLPAFLTNVWQMLSGPFLMLLLRRLWPLLICAAAGTLIGAGWLTEDNARIGTAILGAVLALYAAVSLRAVQHRIPPRSRVWAGPLAGGATGLATAATGVSSIPVVPYLQAIGYERDELVQAMGLCFTVSTLALAFNLTTAGALSWSIGREVTVAIAAVFAGQWLGQIIRKAVDPVRFRTVFLLSLLILGAYLLGRAVFSP